MFDMLTTAELFTLHTSLHNTHCKLNAKIVSTEYPYDAIIDPLSEDWAIVAAACTEVSETMHAIHAEITRRDHEAINA